MFTGRRGMGGGWKDKMNRSLSIMNKQSFNTPDDGFSVHARRSRSVWDCTGEVRRGGYPGFRTAVRIDRPACCRQVPPEFHGIHLQQISGLRTQAGLWAFRQHEGGSSGVRAVTFHAIFTQDESEQPGDSHPGAQPPHHIYLRARVPCAGAKPRRPDRLHFGVSRL